MAAVISFMESPLVLWMRTFSENKDPLDFQELCDAVFLNDVIIQIDHRDLDLDVDIKRVAKDTNARVHNWGILLRNICSYYQDVLQQLVVMEMPDLVAMVKDPTKEVSLASMKKVLLLLLGCAMQCDRKEDYINIIKSMDLDVQQAIVGYIQEVTDKPENVLPLDPDTGVGEKQLYRVIRDLVSERDRQSQRLVLLSQERDYYKHQLVAQRGGSSLSPPSHLEKYHLQRELSDSRAQSNHLIESLEERNKTISELQEDLDDIKTQLLRAKAENVSLSRDAKAVQSYRDELDVLREKAVKLERFEKEVNRYKEKLGEVEYYKSRVEELRKDNDVLVDSRSRLDEQLVASQKKVDSVMDELVRGQIQLEEVNAEKDDINRKLQEVLDENSTLEFEKSRIKEGYSNTNIRRILSTSSMDFASLQQLNGHPISEELQDTMSSQMSRLELERDELQQELDDTKQRLQESQQLVHKLQMETERELERKSQELEHQSKRMRNQASRELSNEYSQKIEEIERRSLELKRRMTDEFTERVTQLERDKKALKARERELENKLHLVEDAWCRDRAKTDVIKHTNKELITERDQTKLDRDVIKHDRDSIKQDRDQLRQTVQVLQDQKSADSEKTIQNLTQERDQIKQDRDSIKQDRDRLRQTVQSQTLQDQQSVDGQRVIQELTQERDQLLQDLETIQGGREYLLEERNQLKVEVNRLQQGSENRNHRESFKQELREVQDTKNQIKELKQEVLKAQGSSDEIVRDLEQELRRIKDSSEIHIYELETQTRKIQESSGSQIHHLRQQLEEAETRYKLAENQNLTICSLCEQDLGKENNPGFKEQRRERFQIPDSRRRLRPRQDSSCTDGGESVTSTNGGDIFRDSMASYNGDVSDTESVFSVSSRMSGVSRISVVSQSSQTPTYPAWVSYSDCEDIPGRKSPQDEGKSPQEEGKSKGKPSRSKFLDILRPKSSNSSGRQGSPIPTRPNTVLGTERSLANTPRGVVAPQRRSVPSTPEGFHEHGSFRRNDRMRATIQPGVSSRHHGSSHGGGSHRQRPVSDYAPFSRGDRLRATMPEKKTGYVVPERRQHPTGNRSSADYTRSSKHRSFDFDESMTPYLNGQPCGQHSARDCSRCSDRDSGCVTSPDFPPGWSSESGTMPTQTPPQTPTRDCHHLTGFKVISSEMVKTQIKTSHYAPRMGEKWRSLVEKIVQLQDKNQQLIVDNSGLRKKANAVKFSSERVELLEKRNLDLEVENRKLHKIVESMQASLNGLNPYDKRTYHFYSNV